MVDLKWVNVKKNRLRVGLLLAFIFSLVGGILLLAFNFAGWYDRYTYWDAGLNQYVVEEFYGEIGVSTAIYGPLIALSGLFLLIITFISLVGMYNPNLVNKKTIALSSILPFFVFLLTAIGAGIASSELSNLTNWWVETGFYGGLLGGLFTFIFFGFVYWSSKKIRAQEDVPSKSITFNIKEQVYATQVVPKMEYCHKCGKEVSGQFCTYCGTKKRETQEYITPKSITPEKVAPEAVHCHECGKEVSGQFCTYCGAKIRAIQEPQVL